MDSYRERARQRLASRTDRTGDCWLWTGATGNFGYGHIYFEGRVINAHRAAWILEHGDIAPGHVVAHRCDVAPCVNPDHLFLATQLENLADMRAKRRQASGPELSAAIRKGWTPEKRARRAEQIRARNYAKTAAAAALAGVPTEWKRCPMCDTWKPRTEYQRNAARHDGIKPICRPCATIQTRQLKAKRQTGSSS